MNQRGFIGAIGDDLPSIIPIVIALLLFFSVFGSTLTTYSQRNAIFSQRIETLSVAREMKGNSLILNIEQFKDNCEDVQIRPRAYSFMVAVFPANHPADQIVVYEDYKTGDPEAFNIWEIMTGSISDTLHADYDKDPKDPAYLNKNNPNLDERYYCEYLRVGARPFSGRESNYIARFYPVAVQTRDERGNIIIVPAIMTMVVW